MLFDIMSCIVLPSTNASHVGCKGSYKYYVIREGVGGIEEKITH